LILQQKGQLVKRKHFVRYLNTNGDLRKDMKLHSMIPRIVDYQKVVHNTLDDVHDVVFANWLWSDILLVLFLNFLLLKILWRRS